MIKNIKRFINLIALIANISVSILFLIAAFSSHISPEKASIPVILGLLYPAFLILNLCFFVYWALLKRWYCLLSICTLLIGMNSISLYFPINFSTPSISKNEKSIELLTYNVFLFDNLKANLPDSPNPILTYIQTVDPDIVCFQEYQTSKNDKLLTESQIKKALKKLPYRSQVAGTACFSKYPIVGHREINYQTNGGNCSVLYKIDVEGDTIIVVNNHLESNRFTSNEKTIYRNMIKNMEPDLWDEMKDRLIRKMIRSTRIRAGQATAVANAIAKTKSDKVIVCGDFNDTPMSYIYRTIRGEMKDAYAEQGFGPGITYHENGFWFRIDHILYGKAFTAVQSSIDRVTYSDHYPLRATLKWNKKENKK